jgi:hypothetical protein
VIAGAVIPKEMVTVWVMAEVMVVVAVWCMVTVPIGKLMVTWRSARRERRMAKKGDMVWPMNQHGITMISIPDTLTGSRWWWWRSWAGQGLWVKNGGLRHPGQSCTISGWL